MKLFNDQLIARTRNKVRNFRHGVPAGIVTPYVRNDLFHAHHSLFEFLGAFTVGRKSLFVGPQAAFGAVCVKEQGAASVVGVITRRRALKFAISHFSSSSVRYSQEVPREQHDVVIHVETSPEIRPSALVTDGKLLVAISPRGPWSQTYQRLREEFASVRRFAHTPNVNVDFERSTESKLTPTSFAFRELTGDESVPPDAITVILAATNDVKWREPQLHVGCGPVTLEGWINIDNQPYPGVDFRWDVARGIPFRGARYIFAEHFIEHLSYNQASGFVGECRASLKDDGVFRLSTPNLDWVFITSYHLNHWADDDAALNDCFVINRAFRGWGHQFLYNTQALAALLHNAGFDRVQLLPYGESNFPALNGLEHHEKYPDSPTYPHVIVAEASGRRIPGDAGKAAIELFERDMSLR